ncbi:MAG: MFS transporter [Firmicutes bacterium]|nr:MFS transporter [Bacillota bacterium]
MASLQRLFRAFEHRLDCTFDGRGREFWVIGVLTFLQGYAWFLVAPFFPLYARRLGADDMLVGLYTMFPPLLSVLVSIPGGAIASSIGSRGVFQYSLTVGFLAAGAYALSPGHWLLCLPQILFGIANALFWPTQTSYMTEVIPERNRGKMLGLMMSITAIGAALGPASAGLVAGYLGYRTVFVVYAVALALSLLACGLLPACNDRVNPGMLRDAVAGSVGSGLAVLSNPALVLTTLVSFTTFMFWAVIETFFPLHLEDRAYAVAAIGGIITVRTTSMTMARIGLGTILGTVRVIPLMFVSLLASAVFMMFVPLARTPPLLVGATAIMGAGSGILPVLTTMQIAMATTPEERPIAMAVDSTACSLGRIAASFMLGVVAKFMGSAASLVVGGALVGALTVGTALWWNYESRGGERREGRSHAPVG